MSKIPSDEILESLYKLRIRESDQLKTSLELYDMEMHQKISVPNYQKLIRNFVYETLMPDMGKLHLEPWGRVAWERLALKEKQVLVSSGKIKASVRKKIVAVSAT